MNIFALSDSPHEAAIWQHDRHVVKMILESAQMLSTWARDRVDCIGGSPVPTQYQDRLYKSTHFNHPCNIWLRDNDSNVVWLALHLDSLVAEYHRRFGKTHATNELRIAFNAAACNIVGVSRMWERDDSRELRLNNMIVDTAACHTPFAVCMPDEHKVYDDDSGLIDAVFSYRKLYLESKIFQSHVKWTKSELPPMIQHWSYGKDGMAFLDRRIYDLKDAHRTQTTPKPSKPIYIPTPIPGNITKFGTKR